MKRQAPSQLVFGFHEPRKRAAQIAADAEAKKAREAKAARKAAKQKARLRFLRELLRRPLGLAVRRAAEKEVVELEAKSMNRGGQDV
jgi:hypothetical protein